MAGLTFLKRAQIIQALAANIDGEGLRTEFLEVNPVKLR